MRQTAQQYGKHGAHTQVFRMSKWSLASDHLILETCYGTSRRRTAYTVTYCKPLTSSTITTIKPGLSWPFSIGESSIAGVPNLSAKQTRMHGSTFLKYCSTSRNLMLKKYCSVYYHNLDIGEYDWFSGLNNVTSFCICLEKNWILQNAVIGHFLYDEPVGRDVDDSDDPVKRQKWSLTTAEYPGDTFPPFAMGQLYVFPTSSVYKVLTSGKKHHDALSRRCTAGWSSPGSVGYDTSSHSGKS